MKYVTDPATTNGELRTFDCKMVMKFTEKGVNVLFRNKVTNEEYGLVFWNVGEMKPGDILEIDSP